MNEYAIELEENKQLSFGPIYSLGPVELETLKTYIKTNLANSFIRASKFPVGTLILFHWKLDRNLRLCVDYWGLNNITIKNRYLLPLIGKSLNWLSWVKRFTQLDLTNSYHRMRIFKDNKWKTIFQTQYSHFKYQVIFFGLSNILAIFQKYVNKILAKKLDIFIIVYLDNILIYIENPDQLYIETICWVLSQLQKYFFFSKLKKCQFYQNKVRFLGYVVLSKKISMKSKQIKVIKRWPKPKSVQDIQVFLSFANSYQ